MQDHILKQERNRGVCQQKRNMSRQTRKSMTHVSIRVQTRTASVQNV